jgi:sec-independent protein translocase protein TatA
MVFGEIIGWDLLIVIAVVALLFGGSKLPKLARSLGSAKGEFERGLRDGDVTASAAPASGTTTVLESSAVPTTDAERRIAEAEERRKAAEAEIARLRGEVPPVADA